MYISLSLWLLFLFTKSGYFDQCLCIMFVLYFLMFMIVPFTKIRAKHLSCLERETHNTYKWLVSPLFLFLLYIFGEEILLLLSRLHGTCIHAIKSAILRYGKMCRQYRLYFLYNFFYIHNKLFQKVQFSLFMFCTCFYRILSIS